MSRSIALTGVVEDLRIGVSAGAEPYMFGEIDAIAQLDDGSVLILDGQRPIIRRYDLDGIHLNDIGRPGQGPGELARVRGLKALPDGNVAVWDSGNDRVSTFAPDGTLLTSFRAREGGFSGAEMQVDVEGNFYLYTLDLSVLTDSGSPTSYWVKLTSTGEPVGTIAVPDDEPDAPGFRVGGLQSFSKRAVHTLLITGVLVVAFTADYAVTIDPSGESPLVVTHPWEPVALEPTEKAQWESFRQFFIAADRRQGRRPPDYPAIPDSKPPLMGLRAGEDGTLWVSRYARAHDMAGGSAAGGGGSPRLTWRQNPTFDAFDEAGGFLGTVELPQGARVEVLHRAWIWTAQLNEEAQPVAVRYRVVGFDR